MFFFEREIKESNSNGPDGHQHYIHFMNSTGRRPRAIQDQDQGH